MGVQVEATLKKVRMSPAAKTQCAHLGAGTKQADHGETVGLDVGGILAVRHYHHLLEKGEHLIGLPIDGVAIQDGVPGHKASLWHFVEHLVRDLEHPTHRVKMHERVPDKEGGVVAVLDGAAVDPLSVAEGEELGAGLEEERVGVAGGRYGGGEHEAVDVEGGEGAGTLGVAADHGVVGEDAGDRNASEDGAGVWHGVIVVAGEGDDGEEEVLGEARVAEGDAAADAEGVDGLDARQGIACAQEGDAAAERGWV
ncbi:hypothetical protein ZIOFF_048409 [Zingiber officinale]|uniref:Uncharacterized protein n=1 Tax=Zingiber officinale TaxID=94328 RepID=A0A8J5KMN5_ZINOF|nr:hypothetical protein ZIOFF_048409 [Zingiber officinale]